MRKNLHPVHYLLGANIFPHQVFDAWQKESYRAKTLCLVAYLLFLELIFFTAGIGYGVSGIAIIGITIMSIPSLLVIERGRTFREKVSIVFLDSIIAFHALIMMSWTVNTIIYYAFSYFGLLGLSTYGLIMAISLFMISYYAMLMASTVSNKASSRAPIYISSFVALAYFYYAF